MTALQNKTVDLITSFRLLTAISRPFFIRTEVSMFNNIRHLIRQTNVQNTNKLWNIEMVCCCCYKWK